MELIVLGSSSDGNCYILQNGVEALILECGVAISEVKKAVDFNIRKIAGALVSHEHGDHAKYIDDFLQSRIPVYASEGTIKNSKIKSRSIYPLYLKSGSKTAIGSFTVLPFDVKHDAKEPLGFLIAHEEIGTMLFITDSYYSPYCFANLTNIMIECNYRQDILDRNILAGRIPNAQRDRLLESHMSFETCKEALLANDLSKVNNIVLIHLSSGNSNAAEFKRDIKKATGKTVHIADKGLKIKINKTPF